MLFFPSVEVFQNMFEASPNNRLKNHKNGKINFSTLCSDPEHHPCVNSWPLDVQLFLLLVFGK